MPVRVTSVAIWAAIAIILLIAANMSPTFAATQGDLPKRPLTVRDTIELRRVLANSAYGREPIKRSPDGSRYAVVTTQGDLKNDGTWLEVLSGRTDSLAAAQPVPVIRLLAKNNGEFKPTHVSEHRIEWLDSEWLGLLWNDGGDDPTQLIAVNARTKKVERLTSHPTDIIHFVGSQAGPFLFTALAPHSREKATELLTDGFVVTSHDALALLRGDVDGWQQWTNFETFVSTGLRQAPKRIVVNGKGADRRVRLLATFSPDGKRLVVDGQPADLPNDWEQYREDILRHGLRLARENPNAPTDVWQLFVIDVHRADSRPLWAAPMMPFARVVWSPDGQKVLVAPAFLPTARADAAGLEGRAAAVVDVATGDFEQIPLPDSSSRGFGKGFRALKWCPDGTLELGDDEVRLQYERKAGAWRLMKREDANATAIRVPTRVGLEIRQSLNSPPILVGTDATTGTEQTLLEFNPELLRNVTLGRVEAVSWRDREHREWKGLLYYPVNHESGQRYPFVIQTHGFSSTDFSLLGNELLTSNAVAQPLANRGMAVLQMQDPDDVVPSVLMTPREPQIAVDGIESAIKNFSSIGLVDPEKVGLIGFSRSGWHVLYALTRSNVPFAAATVADNIDGGYFQAGLHWGWTAEFAQDNGAMPFGSGLRIWLENSPPFNADKVRTPLRLQVDSGGIPFVLTGWEMFSRLRALNKPVELYVVPDVEHGVHGMVRPRQQLASRTGVVDWMEFWLNGHENPEAQQAGNPEVRRTQYARWRALSALRDADADSLNGASRMRESSSARP